MRMLMTVAIAAAALGTGGAAHAQSGNVEGRVDRLEREMRAVQRKVFPGGAGQTVEPQITPETNTVIPGVPASSPVADLTQRVSALEGQLTTLTGQVEQSQYRLRQLEEAFNAYKSATDARLKGVETSSRPSVPGAAVAGDTATLDEPAPASAGRPAPATEKPAAKPTGARAQQVAAVAKPSSNDPAEDAYTYGYRLWQAKLYPEARAQFETVVNKYPQHRRASYSQNLLGRAYLDAGAPSLAAVAFYENYKKNPNGERAPDSLYYLADALTKLKKPSNEVCKVYNELTQLYGDRLSAEMKAGVAEGRATNKCK
ncbi:outer membrane protein assembly factor BamD [Sphingomonas sp. S2-65]|uniref:outer membrane protein assembly factor BamD n=1 Tax=Sphingomonas sp. S2-65 TaxID=2903960 RepID=UPI001F2D3C91|nr:outer membrane protein assembly factor BamD [Sphingomonas sp. S2-65]UYY57398.1 outer membrane protein assembly factor BamD [Sphingomonas sp. S2-65]